MTDVPKCTLRCRDCNRAHTGADLDRKLLQGLSEAEAKRLYEQKLAFVFVSVFCNFLL